VAEIAGRGCLRVAASALAQAEVVLSDAVARARERRQFGRPIGQFQAVAQLLARARVETELAASSWLVAAKRLDRAASPPAIEVGASLAQAVLVATIRCRVALERVIRTAQQVHGASGFQSGGALDEVLRGYLCQSLEIEPTPRLSRFLAQLSWGNSE
jgi:alkylation response protein AidB-like acyl-CoA dehydrogenase